MSEQKRREATELEHDFDTERRPVEPDRNYDRDFDPQEERVDALPVSRRADRDGGETAPIDPAEARKHVEKDDDEGGGEES